jgi:hypothetical protein
MKTLMNSSDTRQGFVSSKAFVVRFPDDHNILVVSQEGFSMKELGSKYPKAQMIERMDVSLIHLY